MMKRTPYSVKVMKRRRVYFNKKRIWVNSFVWIDLNALFLKSLSKAMLKAPVPSLIKRLASITRPTVSSTRIRMSRYANT